MNSHFAIILCLALTGVGAVKQVKSRAQELAIFDSKSVCCQRSIPLRLRRRAEPKALLNLGNGQNWPDVSGMSETVMRAMQGMLGKQNEISSSTLEAASLQRKRQEEAEKFVRAIEREISQWIKKVK